ncbi:MAG TPA: BhlA/UviB family holin-like peptide [Bacillota bacterium]|nr:BhlA/UviB family holin-like peptide [Bacillota bacterium]
MEQEIIKLAASQGLWAVLFVALLFYVLKENAKREERLLSCLDALGKQYESLSRDIGEVKDDVKELKGRVGV